MGSMSPSTCRSKLEKSVVATFESYISTANEGLDYSSFPYVKADKRRYMGMTIFEEGPARRCYKAYDDVGTGEPKVFDMENVLYYYNEDIYYGSEDDEQYSVFQFPVPSANTYAYFPINSHLIYVPGAEHFFFDFDSIILLAKLPEDGKLKFNRANRKTEEYFLTGVLYIQMEMVVGERGSGWFIGPPESPFCRDYSTTIELENTLSYQLPVGCIDGKSTVTIKDADTAETSQATDFIWIHKMVKGEPSTVTVLKNILPKEGIDVVTAEMIQKMENLEPQYTAISLDSSQNSIDKISEPGTYIQYNDDHRILTEKKKSSKWSIASFSKRGLAFGINMSNKLTPISSGTKKILIQVTDSNVETEMRYYMDLKDEVEMSKEYNNSMVVVFETKYGIDGLVNITMQVNDIPIPFSYHKFMTNREEFLDALGVKINGKFDRRKCYMDQWGNMMVHPSLLKDKKFTKYPDVQKLIDIDGSLMSLQ